MSGAILIYSTGRKRVRAALHPITGDLLIYAPAGMPPSGVLAATAGQLDGDLFAEVVDALDGLREQEATR